MNSPLLQEIYGKLWGELWDQESQKWMKNGETIQADTMTSVQTTLNNVVEYKVETEEEKKIREKRKEPGKYYDCSLRYYLQRYKLALDDSSDDKSNDFSHRLHKVKGLELFLSMYHTIGNFIPTPRGFNSARSGGGDYDYWDLTLLKIKEWYEADNDIKKEKALFELLHNSKAKILQGLLDKKEEEKKLLNKLSKDKENKDIIEELILKNKEEKATLIKLYTECKNEDKETRENCEKWLKACGKGEREEGWKNFIDNNYLQDFVQGDSYEPIQFCKNHGWDNIKIDDYVEFFLTVSSLIYLRGKRLIAALEKKQQEEQEKKQNSQEEGKE